MIAHWTIARTGEKMKALVTLGFQSFERMIDSHPKMQFNGWNL